MAERSQLTRRRLLTISAAGATVALLPGNARASRFDWSGFALGADARIQIAGLDEHAARRIVDRATAEIERLEAIFSLYREESELNRLNRAGHLAAPSHDMRRLLARALDLWQRTDGSFNPTIQPVWTFLAGHFARHPDENPDPARLGEIAARCDPARIDRSPNAIRLAPGMALTFNGIAQGYITDRIADLMLEDGLRDILVSLGEHRALPGKRWHIAVPDLAESLSLQGRAVATSRPDGTRLDESGRWHHLIDPSTGRPADGVTGVTVLADDATLADGLATALAVAPASRRAAIARRFPGTRSIVIDPDGRARDLG